MTPSINAFLLPDNVGWTLVRPGWKRLALAHSALLASVLCIGLQVVGGWSASAALGLTLLSLPFLGVYATGAALRLVARSEPERSPVPVFTSRRKALSGG